MADTIITTPSNDSNATGFMMALILVAVIAIGGFVMYKNGYFHSPKSNTTNVNVTIPNPTTPAAQQ